MAHRRPLQPLIPPLRFAIVEEGIYRGAYPSLINFRYLQRLQLRTVVSLLPEAPTPDLLAWCEANGIRNHAERIAVFKDEVTLTQERAASILQLLILPERQPVFIHCLDGISVTGTILMCLRKLQRWVAPSIHAEFLRFASSDGASVLAAPPAHIAQFVDYFKVESVAAEFSPSDVPEWLEWLTASPTRGAIGEQARAIRADAFGTTSTIGVHSAPRTVPYDRLASDEGYYDRRELDTVGSLGSLPWRREPRRERVDGAPTPPQPTSRAGLGASGRPMAMSSSLNALAIEGLTMGHTMLLQEGDETERQRGAGEEA
mmetsp:Transcript_23748/g.69715  ORF Transcript_23748/g.69715 Transcript_23748/m.69715 type:complete len:316 (+) Transcript_23748:33-980(+)